MTANNLINLQFFCGKSFLYMEKFSWNIIMHPRRGPKGRGVAPIGAARGVHEYLFTFFGYYIEGVYTYR